MCLQIVCRYRRSGQSQRAIAFVRSTMCGSLPPLTRKRRGPRRSTVRSSTPPPGRRAAPVRNGSASERLTAGYVESISPTGESMTSPAASGPSYDKENLRLAYAQQVENIREAKRLQWQLTYLGLVALAALAGAFQLLRDSSPGDSSLGAKIFTAIGGVGTIATGWII